MIVILSAKPLKNNLNFNHAFSISFNYRNVIYNLSIFDLTEQQRLIWYSPDDDSKMCLVKGKDEVSQFSF